MSGQGEAPTAGLGHYRSNLRDASFLLFEVFGRDETTGKTETFSFSEMKMGYGAGLRVNSPVGILRVDFGIPTTDVSKLTVRGLDWRKPHWYFGIGHIF